MFHLWLNWSVGTDAAAVCLTSNQNKKIILILLEFGDFIYVFRDIKFILFLKQFQKLWMINKAFMQIHNFFFSVTFFCIFCRREFDEKKSLKTAEQEEQREILALKRLDAENLQIRFVFRLLVRRLFKYVITHSYLHFTEVPFF